MYKKEKKEVNFSELVAPIMAIFETLKSCQQEEKPCIEIQAIEFDANHGCYGGYRVIADGMSLEFAGIPAEITDPVLLKMRAISLISRVFDMYDLNGVDFVLAENFTFCGVKIMSNGESDDGAHS